MSVRCRAKVNLTLHVGAPLQTGRWANYHPIESLVVFADVGDLMTFLPASETTLTIDGPTGTGLSAGPDNLILRAFRLCDAPPQAVHLSKHLPVSSGLGGGSANAAAVLRNFDPHGEVDDASLGADIPICRLSQTAMMTGIGEQVEPIPGLGTVAAVLVNPGVPVSTAAIFQSYDSRRPALAPKQTERQGSLLDRARSGTNDLEDDAKNVALEIATVLAALRAQPGCDLARMSGSGATCFGLFADQAAAARAAAGVSRPDWWVVVCQLGDSV